jgi:hypothetical protein
MPRVADRKLIECPCGCGNMMYDIDNQGRRKKYAARSCYSKLRWGHTLAEKFENKVIRKGEDECWGWKGKLWKGYGRMRMNFKELTASRVSYELFVGPIPEGMHVLHKCDNPECTNPRHLFLGTHEDNMNDMARKKRNAAGKKYGYDKVLEVKRLLETGMSYTQVSKVAGMSAIHIARISKGQARAWGV